MIDGDDTYPAEFARKMTDEILKNGVDMVIGDRLSSTYFTENKRMFHNSGNVLVKRLVNTFFKGDVSDIMTGYRAFSHIFVKSFPVLSKGFEIETEMTIHALDKNLSLCSIPVTYRDRPQGSESKLNTIIDGFKVIMTIIRLFKDYRPFLFFGSFAIIFLLISILMFMPILFEYINTGLVPRIPTLIVAAVSGLAAIQSFTCGLILDTESKKAKQNFELQLNIIRMHHKVGERYEETYIPIK